MELEGCRGGKSGVGWSESVQGEMAQEGQTAGGRGNRGAEGQNQGWGSNQVRNGIEVLVDIGRDEKPWSREGQVRIKITPDGLSHNKNRMFEAEGRPSHLSGPCCSTATSQGCFLNGSVHPNA
ncbi:hypothetical protein KIL84_004808 [Mauremys mutica]|uniref:Uncharacterized protein n=1 Tax=Mauremys mutica TaxID=74926 RepID=A0A9D4B793_9SAUR|nr:hypothetical protein KIL84_004808 [Mauremys mutica]